MVSLASRCYDGAQPDGGDPAPTQREAAQAPLGEAEFERLREKAILTDADIHDLMLAFEDYVPSERVRPYGPETGRTAVTDIMIHHSAQTKDALTQGLRSGSGDVRRYSAYCLGEIGDVGASVALKAALSAELQLLDRSQFMIAGRSAEVYLSPFLAMARAHNQLTSRETAQFLLDSFESRDTVRNLAINVALSELFPQSTVATAKSRRELQSSVLRNEWNSWLGYGTPPRDPH